MKRLAGTLTYTDIAATLLRLNYGHEGIRGVYMTFVILANLLAAAVDHTVRIPPIHGFAAQLEDVSIPIIGKFLSTKSTDFDKYAAELVEAWERVLEKHEQRCLAELAKEALQNNPDTKTI